MRNIDNSTPVAGGTTPPVSAAASAPPGISGPTAPQVEAKRPASAGREGLVFLSISIVSVALATMFYTHLSLSFSSALFLGAAAWSAFMLIHRLVQKSAQVAQLKAELARTRGHGPRLRNALKLQPVTALDAAAATTIDARAADIGAAGPQTESSLTAVAAGSPPPPAPDFSGLGGFGRRLRTEAPRAANPPPNVSLPAAPSFASAPTEAAVSQSPEGLADPLREQWSLRPRHDARAVSSDGSVPAAPQSDRPASSLTIEGDLDLVLRKIKELADEVNAADTLRSAPSLPPVSPFKSKADAIGDSIGALKAAAGTMRERGLPEYIPGFDVASVSLPPQQATMPPQNLGDLIIPSTAERIAGFVERGSAPGLPEGRREPAFPDLPPQNFSTPPQSAAGLASAIDSGSMTVTLAPIVTLASHSVGHYEMSVVLKSAYGEPINVAEDDFKNVAADIGVRFDIARLNRAAALALRMETRDKDGALLTNFMGSSFASRPFLEAFASTYEGRQRIATQLVPVLSQRSVEAFTPAAWQALRDMHTFGFRFALDGVSNVTTDFSKLALAGFRFVRLDARVLTDGVMAADRFVTAEQIRQRISLAGLYVIADSVGDARLQATLLDAGVALGQGPLFGVAREVNIRVAASAQRSAA